MRWFIWKMSGVIFLAAVGTGQSALGTEHEGGSPGVTGTPTATLNEFFRVARLDGSQEVPPVSSAGSGSATVKVERDNNELDFALSVSGLSSEIVAAHIHVGAPGTNGPVIFTLSNGPFASPLRGEIEATGFTARPEVGINTIADAFAAIESGNAYVNVHTANNPDGEIRGQLVERSATTVVPIVCVLDDDSDGDHDDFFECEDDELEDEDEDDDDNRGRDGPNGGGGNSGSNG